MQSVFFIVRTGTRVSAESRSVKKKTKKTPHHISTGNRCYSVWPSRTGWPFIKATQYVATCQLLRVATTPFCSVSRATLRRLWLRRAPIWQIWFWFAGFIWPRTIRWAGLRWDVPLSFPDPLPLPPNLPGLVFFVLFLFLSLNGIPSSIFSTIISQHSLANRTT